MKKHTHIFTWAAICGLLLTGCDKYLDISPKGTQLLTTVEDYDQWLNSETLVYGVNQPFGMAINYLTDEVDLVNISTPPTRIEERIYTWGPQFEIDLSSPPLLWGEHYAKINHFNTVLNGIEEATGGTTSEKQSLKAEALLGRALEYFYLLNEYGKPYDPATAEQDLAVPFVTSDDVTQTVPPRNSVAAIYKRIIDDVKDALPHLPENNSTNRFRGSKAAAYSMLARIYFYGGDYAEAGRNAELALTQTRATMIDLNGTLPASDVLSIREDVIYGRLIIGQAPVSLEFMRTFSSDDLRVNLFYTSTDGYTFTIRGGTSFSPALRTPPFTYVNSGTSVQEMKLIIAETAARAGELTIALQHLHEIRENRIDASTYIPFESNDQEAVLQEVLMERRHELAFAGLRWFDMRRLAKEGRMEAVHRYNANGDVVATLEPNSDRYTLQIPLQVINFNPGMEQNP